MRRLHRPFTFLFAVLILVSAPGFGQIATGLPPFGTFAGGPDVINVGNLNVHISMPVLQKGGRGQSFSYIINYDSSIWGQYAAWTPTSSTWGWSGFTEAFAGYITYTTSQGSCRVNGQILYFDVYNSWYYQDSTGASHYFSGAVGSVTSCPGAPPNTATWVAADGSGCTMTADATLYPPTATVTSSSGVIFKPPLQTPTGTGTLQDSNGNKMNTTSGTSFYDTLNATTAALTITGSAPNPVYYKYYDSAGNLQSVVMTYASQNVKTNFGCSGVGEYTQTGVSLVDKVTYPDGSYYQFTYEPTPGYSGYVTGRIHSVRFPTAGTITYAYSGGSNGIICSDGSTAGFTRTTPDGQWTYAHAENGLNWTTTVTDPQGNETDYSFYSWQAPIETQRQIKQGTTTVLATVNTCYNTPCSTTFSLPISHRSVQVTVGSLEAQTDTFYDTYGLPTEVDEYGYGSGAPGSLVRKTLTTYNRSLTNNIVDRPPTSRSRTAQGVQ